MKQSDMVLLALVGGIAVLGFMNFSSGGAKKRWGSGGSGWSGAK